jgi:hypothetical protein
VIITSFVIPHIKKYSQEVKTRPGNVALNSPAPMTQEPLNAGQESLPKNGMQEQFVIDTPHREEANMSIADIVRRNTRSIVIVTTPRGFGSGFFINNQGFIVTNKHVLSEEGGARIKTSSGNVYKINRIMAMDDAGDLVIASTETPENEIFPVNLTAMIPEIGEKILVIGTPMGLEQTVSDGIVSAIRTNQQSVNYIQVTAPISPGSSGGPLINIRGEVIGVATFHVQGQNLNFCVAAERIMALQNGTVQAANQQTGRVFKTTAPKDVYCYIDSQWMVHFVDWNTGIMISRPDGSLDKVKYEKWVLDKIGGHPYLINAETEAQEALEKHRGELFKTAFPNKSSDDKNLTAGEQQFWEYKQKKYYTDAYNSAVARRNTAVDRYNYLMLEFNKYSSSR